MSKDDIRYVLAGLANIWYFLPIAIVILLIAIGSVGVFEQKKSQIKNNTNHSETNHEPRRRANEAFAESYPLDVKGVPDTAAIHPSFEENRPEQLIAPESFGKTYDYYINNLELYFADENGKIYQIPTKGMAVKIGSPVRSVVYLTNSKLDK